MANTLLTLSLAVLRSTSKEMVLAALVVSNSNLRLKESIYGRMPGDLETFYKNSYIVRFIMESEIVKLYSPSFWCCPQVPG